MSLTRIGSIGINTGIAFAGVTTIVTLNTANDALSIGATVNVGSGITLGASGDGFYTGVVTATSFVGDGSGLTGAGPSLTGSTNNTVVTVTGSNAVQGEANLTFDGSILTVTGNVDLPDNTSGNASLRLGNSQDFYLNHNGTDSFIINNTGDLYVRDLNGDVHIQGKDAEESIIAKADGAVELYHNNTKMFETTSLGVRSYGILSTDSYITISNSADLYLGDNGKARFGDGSDLQIHHDGTDSYMSNANGDLYINNVGASSDDIIIKSKDDIYIMPQNGEYGISVIGDGSVDLYHDNTKTAWTHGSGFNIKGSNTSDQTELIVSGNEGQNAEILLAADDGDDNADYWKIVSSNDNSFYLQNYAAGSYETNIKATGNGAVEIYHDNVKKLETGAGGIKLPSEAGGQQLSIGASGDFTIEHDGSNTYLKNTTGNTVIQNDAVVEITASSGGTKRFRFDSDGLKFGSDTAAANALDDYEEGTFSATVTSGGTVSSFSHNKCSYIKIGRQVFVQIYVAINGSGNSNILKIGNLPFAAANYSTYGFGGFYVAYENDAFQTRVAGHVQNLGTDINFYKPDSNIFPGNGGNVFGNRDFILIGQYQSG